MFFPWGISVSEGGQSSCKPLVYVTVLSRQRARANGLKSQDMTVSFLTFIVKLEPQMDGVISENARGMLHLSFYDIRR